jgi:hypothetical protein
MAWKHEMPQTICAVKGFLGANLYRRQPVHNHSTMSGADSIICRTHGTRSEGDALVLLSQKAAG